MPELPEVETVVRDLRPCITGRRIKRVEVFDEKITLDPRRLPGNCRICGVNRIGKEIVIDLQEKSRRKIRRWLCVHLRMTGRLMYSVNRELDGKPHLRARITLDTGYMLYYDLRRFGVLRLLDDLTDAFSPGIDPLIDAFTVSRLRDLLDNGRQEIKPWLLRQDRLVGLGNIYASEILFAAKIHPRRPTVDLGLNDIRRVHRQTRRILNRAIEYCGTTFSDFQGGRGQNGRFRQMLKVYDREGKPCIRCKTAIIRLVQQGRSTYYCPCCQPDTGND